MKFRNFYDSRHKLSREDLNINPDVDDKLSLLFPSILAGKDIIRVSEVLKRASSCNKPILFCMGAHVIKCGLSPIVIELFRRGFITHVAMNGAGAIHDYELSVLGATSEYVESSIAHGEFGVSRQTHEFFRRVHSKYGDSESVGYGEAIALEMFDIDRILDYSILANVRKQSSIHVGIGTDIIHMGSSQGAAIGNLSMKDFDKICSLVTYIGKGGVILNVGSSVILPEVILKAIARAKAEGFDLSGCTLVDLDMIQNYRSKTRVAGLAQYIGGEGISLTGHHEIMLPILYKLLLE